MMVQRTRAAQAEKVWLDFVAEYPTFATARKATDTDLMAALKPLGLTWRSRNIVAAIREKDSSKLGTKALRGADHYVEAAVNCFAHGRREGLVDANVVRVYSRLFGFAPDDRTRRAPAFHELAARMLPRQLVREYNWALLDLGGTVCLPAAPLCQECPLRKRCSSREEFESGRLSTSVGL